VSEDDRIVHLLSRATFGVRYQDIESVREVGIDVWLDRQLRPEQLADPLEKDLAVLYPSVLMDAEALLAQYPPPAELQAFRAQRQDSASALTAEDRQRIRRELAARGPANILRELTAAKLTRAAHSERQLEEMMVDFWFDHFNVFWAKGADRWLVPDYERTAIRPYVFGTFEDMLVATATHPAMLFYLDNWRSMAPDTAAIRGKVLATTRRMNRGRSIPPSMDMSTLDARLAKLPGLNENYARELLELHTLGVDGGYTQDDVIDVARAFTGWSVQMPRREERESDQPRRRPEMAESAAGDYGFVYRDQVHDKGRKEILGHELAGHGGREEGLEVLRILATHPSTAQHVATQLVTRFVSDEPPLALVEHIASVFLATSGDLREVTRALFSADEFYAHEHIRAKVKSPVALVASALRVTDAEIVNPRGLIEVLRSLEQAPYLADAPTGYDETSSTWASSGAMLNRMNFGIALASGDLAGVRAKGSDLPHQASTSGETTVHSLAAAILPGVHSETLVSLIREDLAAEPPASKREGAARTLGMLLGSPEFQKH